MPGRVDLKKKLEQINNNEFGPIYEHEFNEPKYLVSNSEPKSLILNSDPVTNVNVRLPQIDINKEINNLKGDLKQLEIYKVELKNLIDKLDNYVYKYINDCTNDLNNLNNEIDKLIEDKIAVRKSTNVLLKVSDKYLREKENLTRRYRIIKRRLFAIRLRSNIESHLEQKIQNILYPKRKFIIMNRDEVDKKMDEEMSAIEKEQVRLIGIVEHIKNSYDNTFDKLKLSLPSDSEFMLLYNELKNFNLNYQFDQEIYKTYLNKYKEIKPKLKVLHDKFVKEIEYFEKIKKVEVIEDNGIYKSREKVGSEENRFRSKYSIYIILSIVVSIIMVIILDSLKNIDKYIYIPVAIILLSASYILVNYIYNKYIS